MKLLSAKIKAYDDVRAWLLSTLYNTDRINRMIHTFASPPHITNLILTVS